MTDICKVVNGMEKMKEYKLFVVCRNIKCVGHQMELTDIMTRISKRRFFLCITKGCCRCQMFK